MRYHDLKEKDALTLYEDGLGTLVSLLINFHALDMDKLVRLIFH